jgi:hypothetical protein
MAYLPLRINPKIKETKNTIKKIQNSHIAIVCAPAAIPPKPKRAATMAMMKKMTAQ